MVARLKEKYENDVRPKLMEQFGIANVHAVPRIEKIVTNIGVGQASREPQQLEVAAEKLAAATGQKARITRARKSISGFKVREGNIVGCKVTLRGGRMYEFLDRLLNVAVPRVRDFRGLNPSAFDGRGNYNMGLSEQSVFPEIDPAAMTLVHGMNISMQSSTDDDEQSRALLKMLGMPFKENES